MSFSPQSAHPLRTSPMVPTYLIPLYKSLIISSLEYCCQIWSPHAINEIQLIENVQRTFTRRLIGSDHDYWERLKILNLYSLQRRRERYIIIYNWKVLEGLVPKQPNHTNGQKSSRNKMHPCVVTRYDCAHKNSN